MLCQRQLKPLKRIIRLYSEVKYPNIHFHPGFAAENVDKFADSFLIYENLVSPTEEETFMAEMEPHLKRHVYEKDHWDDVSLPWEIKTVNLKCSRQFKALERRSGNFSTILTPR